MKNIFCKRPILVCLLFCACAVLLSCGSKKQPLLEAEVKIANESVYVWNRGEQAWSGGEVFLNDLSQAIQKSFKATINPGGFVQLPIREFKQGGKMVSAESLEIKFVWVQIEGYEPKKFDIE
jgi:hypothetical protein